MNCFSSRSATQPFESFILTSKEPEKSEFSRKELRSHEKSIFKRNWRVLEKNKRSLYNKKRETELFNSQESHWCSQRSLSTKPKSSSRPTRIRSTASSNSLGPWLETASFDLALGVIRQGTENQASLERYQDRVAIVGDALKKERVNFNSKGTKCDWNSSIQWLSWLWCGELDESELVRDFCECECLTKWMGWFRFMPTKKDNSGLLTDSLGQKSQGHTDSPSKLEIFHCQSKGRLACSCFWSHVGLFSMLFGFSVVFSLSSRQLGFQQIFAEIWIVLWFRQRSRSCFGQCTELHPKWDRIEGPGSQISN